LEFGEQCPLIIQFEPCLRSHISSRPFPPYLTGDSKGRPYAYISEAEHQIPIYLSLFSLYPIDYSGFCGIIIMYDYVPLGTLECL